MAQANAEVADEQRTLALDTLHNLVTKVDAKLRDRADLADLQKDVLQDAFNGLAGGFANSGKLRARGSHGGCGASADG